MKPPRDWRFFCLITAARPCVCILNCMRPTPLMLVLLLSCGPSQTDVEISVIEQEYNSDPPPTLVCKGNEMVCSGKCIDISSNSRNCGWCENWCDLSAGEFCVAYHCANVRDYGFSIGPVGPKRYDVRRDLPRPSPINEQKNTDN